MILQALKQYYDRKLADPDSGVAPEGFECKPIPFIIVIDQTGSFVNLEDTRETVGKKKNAKTFIVPRSKIRPGKRGFETTFILWDHIGYLLQYPEDDGKSKKQHQTWLASLEKLSKTITEDIGISAMIKFYQSSGIQQVKKHSVWKECTKGLSCNMTFRLAGETLPIPCHPAVKEYVFNNKNADTDPKRYGRCLITGELAEIVRIHSETPINKDSKKLVGFQKSSGYDSYGKEQAFNAPIGKSAEFAYTTALNTLIKSSSKMSVADTVIFFWSEKRTDFSEKQFISFFKEPPKDNPDSAVEEVKGLYRSLETGVFHAQTDNKFYVLGLSSNSARIAVRLWIVSTVAEMAEKIAYHFRDLQIIHGPNEKEAFSVFRLLRSVSFQEKSENILPNLAGETIRAILNGLPYPLTLFHAAIRRIRAEKTISYPRAALIKAFINRAVRFKNNTIKEELKMSLDENNKNIGYRLGRLFAALEKIQIRVHTQNGGKEPNSTIRDRYYGAASGTPATVFPTIIRMSKHHLSKLENIGTRVSFEKLLGQIMDDITDFPSHLGLMDQGRFAIGYYHQMQDFYKKN